MHMSIEEINEKFDGEWIYAIDCEENDMGAVLSGKVVLHSRNRDDVIRAMGDYEKKVDTLALFQYAGNVPEGLG
ncbi:MAG: hypothetical protein FWG42_00350 [Clostridiales bacterium]|nr:hypothetical protein [Clostridiales bacterium]